MTKGDERWAEKIERGLRQSEAGETRSLQEHRELLEADARRTDYHRLPPEWPIYGGIMLVIGLLVGLFLFSR